jgi:glycosyltransferase involved in cell wall biosynthesis
MLFKMKLSIITINYNNAGGLKKTLDSILGQAERSFEYIVIDGGSTDGSKDLLEQSNGIAYWVSERDKGIYDAMNKGIAKASGEYLLFINSGDKLFEPDTIKKIIPQLDGASIVYGNMKIDEGKQLKDGFMPDTIDLRQMMNDTLWHPVSFIKKELFDKHGLYKTDYKICGDYDFFFNVIIDKKVPLKHINQFICVFDLTGISSKSENAALIKEEKAKVQKSYLSEEQIEEFRKSQSKKINFFTRWFQ